MNKKKISLTLLLLGIVFIASFIAGLYSSWALFFKHLIALTIIAIGFLFWDQRKDAVKTSLITYLKKEEFAEAKKAFPGEADIINAYEDQKKLYEGKVEEGIKNTDFLSEILNKLDLALIVLDKELKIQFMNQQSLKLFDFSTSRDFEDRDIIEVFRDARFSKEIQSFTSDEKQEQREFSIHYSGKNLKTTFLKGFGDDYQIGFVVLFHDESKVKKLETFRRDFIANVSHEFKTPLTSIQGFIETILSGTVQSKEQEKQFLNIIQEESHRLKHLIEDLLKLSEIESDQEGTQKEKIPLKKGIEKVLEKVRPQIEKKKIEVKMDIDADFFVNANVEQFHQVFINLLDNAAKFNQEKGVIQISAEKVGAILKVSVSDTGSGIERKNIGRVFQRFFMENKSRSREMGGTGLGLSIVKHIMENHGGNISCESEVGKGSTFIVEFPLL